VLYLPVEHLIVVRFLRKRFEMLQLFYQWYVISMNWILIYVYHQFHLLYRLRKNFWDTQEWLPKILYFIRIKLYIYGKCIYSLSFHIIPCRRKTSSFNIKKQREQKSSSRKKFWDSLDFVTNNS